MTATIQIDQSDDRNESTFNDCVLCHMECGNTNLNRYRNPATGDQTMRCPKCDFELILFDVNGAVTHVVKIADGAKPTPLARSSYYSNHGAVDLLLRTYP